MKIDDRKGMDRFDKMGYILGHFGIETQLEKLIEEALELLIEIKAKNRKGIKEEFNDLLLVMQQIEEWGCDNNAGDLLDWGLINGKIERKLDRIESGYYEGKK